MLYSLPFALIYMNKFACKAEMGMVEFLTYAEWIKEIKYDFIF